MKRFIALLLSLLLVLPLAACGGGGTNTGNGENPGGSGTEYNTPSDTKSHIRVRTAGGAYGTKWLEIAGEQFAKMHADTVFETGKKGVYIDYLDTFDFAASSMNSSTVQIAQVHKERIEDLASAGVLYDIDEIVRDNSRTGGSLDSIMQADTKGGVMFNDKYYGLPHTEFYAGCSFNYGLFDELAVFFADHAEGPNNPAACDPYDSKFSSRGTEYFTTADGPLSKGPDGISQTEDDGLPTSLEQYLVLMDYLKNIKSTAPVLVGGAVSNYSIYFMQGIWAALAGAEKMRNYYNSRGTVEIVEVLNGEVQFTDQNLFPGVDYIKKPKTKLIELNDANGFNATLMVEKFYAYALFEIMQKEGFWSADVDDGQFTHYDAHTALLCGTSATAMGYQENPAMMVDASYWLCEGRDAGVFRDVEYNTGLKKSEIDCRVMSLPSYIYTADAVAAEAQNITKPTSFLDVSHTNLVVNGNIKGTSIERATVEFLKFLYSDDMLQQYTIITGYPIGLNYEITNYSREILGKTYTMETLYQHLWESRKTDGSNVIRLTGTSDAFKLNGSNLKLQIFTSYLSQLDRSANPWLNVQGRTAAEVFVTNILTQNNWTTVTA